MAERGGRNVDRDESETPGPSTSRGAGPKSAWQKILDQEDEMFAVRRYLAELESADNLKHFLELSFEQVLKLLKSPAKSEVAKLSLLTKWARAELTTRQRNLPQLLQVLDLTQISVEDADFLHKEFKEGVLGKDISCIMQYTDFLFRSSKAKPHSVASTSSATPGKGSNRNINNGNVAAVPVDSRNKKPEITVPGQDESMEDRSHDDPEDKSDEDIEYRSDSAVVTTPRRSSRRKHQPILTTSDSSDDDVPLSQLAPKPPALATRSSARKRGRVYVEASDAEGEETAGGASQGPSQCLIYSTKSFLHSYSWGTKVNTLLCRINTRRFSSIAVAGNEVFVMGGSEDKDSKFGDDSKGSQVVDVFELGGNGGVIRKPGPPLIDPLKEFGSCVLNDTLYTIGGCMGLDATNFCAKLNFRDPDRQWEDFDDFLNVARGSNAVATIQDTIFAIGGVGEKGFSLRSTESYNTSSDAPKWQSTGSLSLPGRARFGTATIDGKIYAVGGDGNGTPLKTVERFDPANNHWLPVHSRMNHGRRDHCVFVMDGRIYAVGGNLSPRNKELSMESFDPREGKWTLTVPWAKNLFTSGEFSSAVTLFMSLKIIQESQLGHECLVLDVYFSDVNDDGGIMDTLPSYFDLVVIGTGVTESVVSAAAARQGHTVLHIDPRDYYGGKWATLAWNDWDSGKFAQIPPTLVVDQDGGNQIGHFRSLLGEDEDLIWKNDIRDFESLWYTEDPQIKTAVTSLSRRFNIDIIPKVLMARERVIELLIQSNVSRYLEFTCINKLMTSLPPPDDSHIEPIPLSRSDIFTTNTISLVEKRRLMKFLQFVLNPDCEEQTEPVRATFAELAGKHQLSPKVSHLLQAAIRTMDDALQMAQGDESDTFNLKFTDNCRLFLQSINRYGNQTPFLWTLYGVSEICQAFCRLSAIYGGTFILKRPFQSITEVLEEGARLLKLETDGVEVRTKFLVLCPEVKLSRKGIDKSPKCIQGITLVRGVLLVTGPRLNESSQLDQRGMSDGNNKKLAIYRFGDMDVVELDETSYATPVDYRILQVSLPHREGYPSPREVVESRLRPYLNFQPAESTDPGHDRSRVLYGSYFLADFYDDIKDQESSHPQIFHSNTPSSELKDHVDKGMEIFMRMFPGEEFLPKLPEPAEVDADQGVGDGQEHRHDGHPEENGI